MSKRVKNLIIRDLSERLKDAEAVGVLNPRGIDATKNNQLRRRLREKGLRMTVVRNNMLKRAVGERLGRLKGCDVLLDGPSALVYGTAGVSAIARTLLDEKKLNEALELRGVFFDGEVFAGEEGVQTASKLPTREEAIGQVLTLLLSPGRRLAGMIKGPAGRLAGLVKAIEERAKSAGGAEAAPAAN